MAKSCCPHLHSFGHAAQTVQPLHRPDLPGAACLASGADRCSVSNVRACRGMVCPGTCPAMILARPALLPVLCSRSGCAGVGRGTPAGYIAAAQPRPVSLPTTEKIKKAQKMTPPPLLIFKIFRKNKKTPTKGLCSVLYLLYKP